MGLQPSPDPEPEVHLLVRIVGRQVCLYGEATGHPDVLIGVLDPEGAIELGLVLQQYGRDLQEKGQNGADESGKS